MIAAGKNLDLSLKKSDRIITKQTPAGAPAGVFCVNLLLNEGHAVGALVDGRVGLMGADADAIEGTVILAAAVVAALGDMAFDAVVCFFRKMTHSYFLLFESTLSVPHGQRDIRTNFFKKWLTGLNPCLNRLSIQKFFLLHLKLLF